MAQPLPIDALVPDLCATLRDAGALVLESPPGSGKTTRVPPALAAGCAGQVWVLEPRRIAARASAARVSAERGEPVGGFAGYAVRFDRQVGPSTRVVYVTEALLLRRMAEDPLLKGIDAVVLDEFHERSIHTDLALALVAGLRKARPDLQLLVMSATFDGKAVAEWLGCPRVAGGGRPFPVEIDWLARPDDRPVAELAAAAVRAEVGRLEGDRRAMLVFLPGVGEIQRCQELLAGLGVEILPLHGELDAASQDRALRPRPGVPRVVLATNVAETSVTVADVGLVVDSGLARVAGHDPWAGISTLTLEKIARSAADQRAGRAGRTGPGRCLRLYPEADYRTGAPEPLPELRRADLAGVWLDLAARERRPGERVEPTWFEAPEPGAWLAAKQLLVRLGALADLAAGPADPDQLTAIGRAMAGLPLAPRLARLAVEGAALGVPRAAAALAVRLGQVGRRVEDPVLEVVHGRVPDGQAREVRQVHQALGGGPDGPDVEAKLTRALLAAFPDRVGQRRGERGGVRFAEGGSAEVDEGVPGGDTVLVSGVERIGGKVRVRAMTPVPADWLVDRAEVRVTYAWRGEKVEVLEQLAYGAVILDEAAGEGEPARVAALLAEHALPVAHRLWRDAERAQATLHRWSWLARRGDWPASPPGWDELIHRACISRRSFAELRDDSLVAALDGDLGALDQMAPEAIPLGNRARVAVVWSAEHEPYLASRMQDFFGLTRTPTIGRGHPLVLHLLAPSGRPVQVTQDLAGFWTRHYPSIRKELCRKYPRHYWPEDPTVAEPIQHVRGGVPVVRRS